VDFKFFETRLNHDTVSLANGYDFVCVFVNDIVDKPVIDALCKYGVKLIALRCAGFNNVDIKHAEGKISVVRVPAYSPYAVAEHAMALLLTHVRNTHKAYIRTKGYNFSLNGLCGFDLHNKTVGVIGTGKIGRIFVDICKGFGMKVLAYDKFRKNDDDTEYTTLESLFKQSDIISLHCPLTEDTYHLINENSIRAMKKGVVIVNTSRGALIDAKDLIEGIKSKKIGGACLDVYEEEADVFYEDNSSDIIDDDTLAVLLSLPNVLITSHQAFLTEEALANIAKTTVDNIKEFFDTGKCENEVVI
jgi:D-lactate dehydrogenase